MNTFSSNEVFSIATQAIRGAGWSQGVAQDGARGAVLLSQIGFDGIKATIAAIDGHSQGSRVFTGGLAAIDRLLSGENSRIELPRLDAPLLQWGLCCVASRETGIKIGVFMKSGQPLATPDQLRELLWQGMDIVVGHFDKILTDSYPPAMQSLRLTGADEMALARAKKLAHNIYVPSSTISHQFGAGSTKSDND